MDRRELIDAGVRLLDRAGVQALQARKLAAEVGTSTMAVYTHFGGMTGLLDAIAEEAFARFGQALLDVPETDDPVADFLAIGIAYREFALANPQRYQLIFGVAAPESISRTRTDFTIPGATPIHAGRAGSFDAMRRAVGRMVGAGRIRAGNQESIAGRLWSLLHGAVMLELAGFFGNEQHTVSEIFVPLGTDMLVALGDDRDAVTSSRLSAVAAALG